MSGSIRVGWNERLLSQSHLRCSKSKHPVFEGGTSGNIQKTPGIFLLFTLMSLPLQITIAIFVVVVFYDDTRKSHLLRPKTVIIIDFFFPS